MTVRKSLRRLLAVSLTMSLLSVTALADGEEPLEEQSRVLVCGMEEHVHTEECYVRVLTCELTGRTSQEEQEPATEPQVTPGEFELPEILPSVQPGIEEPGIEEPGTDAPEVDAPEVDAPEVDAPETDVPEADVPLTDLPMVVIPGELDPDMGVDAGEEPETQDAPAPETDAEAEDAAPETEDGTPEAHVHTDSCYEDRLVCGMEEHTHAEECWMILYAEPAPIADGAPADDIARVSNAKVWSGEIYLQDDEQLSKTIEITTDTTVYGNGCTVTAAKNSCAFRVKAGATLTLEDVIIQGNGEIPDSAGIVVDGKGTLVMENEATVTGFTNKGRLGGGIKGEKGSVITVNSGSTVSDNRAGSVPTDDRAGSDEHDSRGGGIYTAGELTLNGGIIDSNWAGGSGGGIFLAEAAKFLMEEDSVVSNNWVGMDADGTTLGPGSGVPYEGSEGGGIYVQCNSEDGVDDSGFPARIVSGSIYGNGTHTIFDFGGGGIFVQAGGRLRIDSALITDNTAYNYGGGVAGCTNGVVHSIDIGNGAAVYGNTAIGTGHAVYHKDQSYHNSAYLDNRLVGSVTAGTDMWLPVNIVEQPYLNQIQKPKDKDNNVVLTGKQICYDPDSTTSIYHYYTQDAEDPRGGWNDYYCSRDSVVSSQMLGGGYANWFGTWSPAHDGDVYWTGFHIDTSKMVVGKSFEGELLSVQGLTGLTAHPSDADMESAEDAARVFIYDNWSGTNGGGITCNGYLSFGDAPENKERKLENFAGLTITGSKSIERTETLTPELEEGQFSFRMADEDRNIDVVASNDADGVISFTIPGDQLKAALGSEDSKPITLYVSEIPGEDDKSFEYDDRVYTVQARITKTVDTVITGTNNKLFPELTTVTTTYALSVESISSGGSLDFVNTPKTGKVHLTKTFAQVPDTSEQPNPDATFSFKAVFELDGESAEENFTLGGDYGLTWESDEYPVGTSYVITEEVGDYWTSSGEISGEIDGTVQKMVMTNSYNKPIKGRFSITKEVISGSDSTPVPEGDVFSFTVTVNEPGSEPETIEVELQDGGTWTSGEYLVGTTYTITEEDKEGYTCVSGTVEGEIVDSSTNSHTIVNRYWKPRNVEFNVYKSWSDGAQYMPESVEFELHRTWTDDEGSHDEVINRAAVGEDEEWSHTWTADEDGEPLVERDFEDGPEYGYYARETAVTYAQDSGYQSLRVEGSSLFKVWADDAQTGTDESRELAGGWRSGSAEPVRTVGQGTVEYAQTFDNRWIPADEIGDTSFTVEKLGRDSGAPLSGAEFTLYKDGETVSVQTTGEDGTVTFDGLTDGEYTLSETRAPQGFELSDPSSWTVRVSKDVFQRSTVEVRTGETGDDKLTNEWSWKAEAGGDAGVLTVYNSVKTCDVQVKKEIELDGTPAQAAPEMEFTFRLSWVSAEGLTGHADATANAANGWTASWTDIPYGTYTLSEISGADIRYYHRAGLTWQGPGREGENNAWVLGSKDAQDGAISVTAVNSYEVNRADFSLRKDFSMDNRTLSGLNEYVCEGKVFTFDFTGTGEDGSVINETFRLTEDDFADTLRDLPVGVYTLTETSREVEDYIWTGLLMEDSRVTKVDDYTYRVDLREEAHGGAVEVTAFNCYTVKEASFTIHKDVKLDGAEPDASAGDLAGVSFSFRVAGNDLNGQYHSLSVTVMAGETVRVTLPHGVYTVTEERFGLENYTGHTLTFTGTGGAAVGEGSVTVDLTDEGLSSGDIAVTAENAYSRKTADLDITKRIGGNYADLTSVWDFTVALRAPAPYVELSESYDYTVTGEDGREIPSKSGTVRTLCATDGNGEPTDRPLTAEIGGETYVVYGVVGGLGNGETAHISGLPLGVKYQVTETQAGTQGYDTSYDGRQGVISGEGVNAVTVYNSRSAYTAVTVTKNWVNDRPSQRPESVIAELYEDGELYETFELTAANNWTRSWTGLRFGAVYTVREVNVPEGYTVSYGGNSSGAEVNITVTNTSRRDYTSFTVRKVWVGDNDANRPVSVSVQLLAGGEPYGESVTLSEANSWSYTWTGLDPEMEYTAQELNVPGSYVSRGTANGSEYVITNTWAPKTGITVSKVWMESGGERATENLPASLTVRLYRDGALADTAILTPGNGWSHTWNGLDARASYSVEEETPEGWTGSVQRTGNSFLLTNVRDGDIPEEETPETDITVRKVWMESDGERATENLPASLTVRLYRDGELADTVILAPGNGWSHTWNGLDARASYYVEEETPEGWTGSIQRTGNSFLLTNVRDGDIPEEETPETDITVRKVWMESDGERAIEDLPASLTVRLYRDGELADTVILTPGNGWSHTWNGLDARASYLVEEEPPEGWTGSIQRTGNSFLLMNVRDEDIPDEDIPDEDIPLTDIPDDDVPRDDGPDDEELVEIPEDDVPLDYMPFTGDNGALAFWLAMSAASGAGLVLTCITGRKRRGEDEEE